MSSAASISSASVSRALEELFRVVGQADDGLRQPPRYRARPLNPAFAGGATYQNSEVKLRGFSSLQTTILDQRPPPPARQPHVPAPTSTASRSAAIDRIEILPSSASAIYGGGAIGGAINIITAQAITPAATSRSAAARARTAARSATS
jgi:outer membrane receptor protein involved in Fe transport